MGISTAIYPGDEPTRRLPRACGYVHAYPGGGGRALAFPFVIAACKETRIGTTYGRKCLLGSCVSHSDYARTRRTRTRACRGQPGSIFAGRPCVGRELRKRCALYGGSLLVVGRVWRLVLFGASSVNMYSKRRGVLTSSSRDSSEPSGQGGICLIVKARWHCVERRGGGDWVGLG